MQLVSRRRRAAAWVIELVVVLTLAASGVAVGSAFTGGSVFAAVVVVLTSLWLYFAGFESSRDQTTLSGLILGTRVTGLRGERLTFARATTRHFAMYLSAVTPFFVGYFMALWTKRRQTLHDWVARTVVVRKE